MHYGIWVKRVWGIPRTYTYNASRIYRTEAAKGITVEVTQKSRGNFVLTSQGKFQHFRNCAWTTKKSPVPQKS